MPGRPRFHCACPDQCLRLHLVGQRRRGVDHGIYARQRLSELAVRDVGHLDDLEGGVGAVQRLEGVDLLRARGGADAVAGLQELVDDVRCNKAGDACDLT